MMTGGNIKAGQAQRKVPVFDGDGFEAHVTAHGSTHAELNVGATGVFSFVHPDGSGGVKIYRAGSLLHEYAIPAE